ncbi:MAG: sigma-70 family RNA polymerase sigma factor [Acidobacteriaceae bacterium]|nr:sigma-70 family RNA polymerase sigma factor [Acidobacteriaceae bacterium]
MDEALSTDGVTAEQNRRISDTVRREQARLRQFIRQRVPDTGDAEDIFQEVFYELIEAYRLMKPLEQVGAWLFRVARHRIIDLFRRQRPAVLGNDLMLASEDGETHRWEDLLPSREEGPEAAYARGVLLEELDAALEELPEEQRAVFVAHEIEGRSFRELSETTGVSVNTLLSRKRYAVLQLRRRLQSIYNEWGRD